MARMLGNWRRMVLAAALTMLMVSSGLAQTPPRKPAAPAGAPQIGQGPVAQNGAPQAGPPPGIRVGTKPSPAGTSPGGQVIQTDGSPGAQSPSGPNQGPNRGPGQAPAPGAAGRKDVAPLAPFQLTPEEQKLLDVTLKHWEERNAKVKTFKCTFQRREYDQSLADEKDPELRAGLRRSASCGRFRAA